jgi:glycosyltransferase involved in cell wall biosynthesis
MVMRPSLSVSMIVKDEAETLPGCLESLRGVADEIVVYDTGSTDATREIARDAGCKVVEGFWDDDFARARNDAAAHCSGDWVWKMDADERLVDWPEPVWDALGSCRGFNRFGALELHLTPYGFPPLVNTFFRLWRRGSAFWAGRVHERLVPRGGRATFDDPVTFLPIRVRHSAYADPAAIFRKSQRNLAIARKAIADGAGDLPHGEYLTTAIKCEEAVAAGPDPTPADVLRCGERIVVRMFDLYDKLGVDGPPDTPSARPYRVRGYRLGDPKDLRPFYPGSTVPAEARNPLLDDLVSRGAPPEILKHAVYFLRMAERWGLPPGSATHLSSGVDASGSAARIIAIRRKIAEALLSLADWTPGDV